MTESPESRKDARKPSPFLKMHRETVKSSQKMSPAVLLGSSVALAMGLFVWGGMAFDQHFQTEPLGVISGLLLGLLFGTYEVWKIIHFANREEAERSEESAEES